VEFIKILLAMFLASYFATKWERLRDLREKRFLRFLNLPRIEHAAPVFVAVSIGLAMFFVLKDLGPALVTGFLFLTLFALARGRAGLATLGIALLIGGVTVGYRIGQPKTVVDRIAMWLGPWDNNIHGGNQLAHGLWALATGGAFGSGPGYGDPAMIPACDTDLVLPSIGEEWGYMGVAAGAHRIWLLSGRWTDDTADARDAADFGRCPWGCPVVRRGVSVSEFR
jgi:cell division protein FtsW (lipid II flippase)